MILDFSAAPRKSPIFRISCFPVTFQLNGICNEAMLCVYFVLDMQLYCSIKSVDLLRYPVRNFFRKGGDKRRKWSVANDV